MASRKTKRWLAAGALVVMALLAAFWIGWSWAARKLVVELAAFEAKQAAAGVRIAHDPVTVSGFPTRLVATLTNFDVESPKGRWRAPLITAVVEVIDPMTVHATIPGPTIVDPPAGAIAPGAESITLEGPITVMGHRAGANAARATVSIDHPRAKAAEAARGELAADRVDLDIAWAEPPAGDLKTPAITATFDLVNGEQILGGHPVPGGPYGAAAKVLVKGPVGPGATLAAWRDAGGIVDLSSVEFSAGAVKLALTGTVSLDREFRPMGATTAVIRNPLGILDAAIAAGAVKAKDAFAAKFLLGGMAKPDPATGAPTLTIPISAQDGALFVGPLRLMRLPSIVRQ